MALDLPDPPASLPGAPRAFYDELRRMLDVVRPAAVDADFSYVEFFDNGGLELEIAHAHGNHLSIRTKIWESDAFVEIGHVHEYFSPPAGGSRAERPWTTQAVDFIAEILRGEIEEDTTYRGARAIAVSHYRIEEGGERVHLGETVFLTPARLFLWRPKRVETSRTSFL